MIILLKILIIGIAFHSIWFQHILQYVALHCKYLGLSVPHGDVWSKLLGMKMLSSVLTFSQVG